MALGGCQEDNIRLCNQYPANKSTWSRWSRDVEVNARGQRDTRWSLRGKLGHEDTWPIPMFYDVSSSAISSESGQPAEPGQRSTENVQIQYIKYIYHCIWYTLADNGLE